MFFCPTAIIPDRILSSGDDNFFSQKLSPIDPILAVKRPLCFERRLYEELFCFASCSQSTNIPAYYRCREGHGQHLDIDLPSDS